MANFPFPGMMGRKAHIEDHKNEKTLSKAMHEEGNSSE